MFVAAEEHRGKANALNESSANRVNNATRQQRREQIEQSFHLRESGSISRVCLTHIPLPLRIVPPIESTKVDAQCAGGKARLQFGHVRRARAPAISPTEKKNNHNNQKGRGARRGNGRRLTWRCRPLRLRAARSRRCGSARRRSRACVRECRTSLVDRAGASACARAGVGVVSVSGGGARSWSRS
jgi:hypothetical protein